VETGDGEGDALSATASTNGTRNANGAATV
jgi:hypothetical protein